MDSVALAMKFPENAANILIPQEKHCRGVVADTAVVHEVYWCLGVPRFHAL